METSLLEYDITDRNVNLLKNVLFVHSTVLSLKTYINQETLEIGYGNNSTTDEVMQCFRNWFSSSPNDSALNRIGFAFHFGGQEESPIFMNQEPFFTDTDLGESVETYSRNVQFMLDLLIEFKSITHVDFLACSTLGNDKWKQYYQFLRLKTGVVIGASDDNTGNMKLGGDWVMETTHEEVGQIYFTAEIENWASLLGTYTDSGVTYTNITTTTASVSARNNTNLVSYTILTTVTIDSILRTVTTIPAEAFFCNNGYVSKLTSIIIPSTITSIGGYAFTQTLLTTVNIPSSVTTISDYAFYIISTLTSLTFSIPSSLRNIGIQGFSNTNLVYCWLPYGVISIGAFGFTNGNSIIKLIVLPDTITTLDSTSFYGTNRNGSCEKLYMFSSEDLGTTYHYKKYIDTLPTGAGSNPNTGGTSFNNIITNFKSSSSDTSLWESVISSEITEELTVNNTVPGTQFTVTFNTIIPETRYTITGLTSEFSSSSEVLELGISIKVFNFVWHKNFQVIKISMSDNSVPLSLLAHFVPYIRLPYGHTTIGSDIFVNLINDYTVLLPSTITTSTSTFTNGINSSVYFGKLYMFTSDDNGNTCEYKKYKEAITNENSIDFNNIVINFNENSSNTEMWEPVVSSVITNGANGNHILPGTAFTVRFNTIIPGTTYTIERLTSESSVFSEVLADGESDVLFYLSWHPIFQTIKISMSDNSVPLLIYTDYPSSYCWLEFGEETIGANAFVNLTTDSSTIILPSTIVSLNSTSSYGLSLSSGSFVNLYIFTSNDSGKTCEYKKYIDAIPEWNANTGSADFNNIVNNFNENSLNTTLWQPVVSSAITKGLSGSYVIIGTQFTVTFYSIIPGTTYTITGLTSALSSFTDVLPDGTSNIIFTVSNQIVLQTIRITMSDNSVPLSVLTYIYPLQSYRQLPYGDTTIESYGIRNLEDNYTLILPDTITNLDSTSSYGSVTCGTCEKLYMFTSNDLGVTCSYWKYKDQPIQIWDENTGSSTYFNNIIINFINANSPDEAVWEPVVSSAFTDGVTGHYIATGTQFAVTFNVFIPGTTYTIAGLTSESSSSSEVLAYGLSTKIFTVSTQTNLQIIKISMTDNSAPLSVMTFMYPPIHVFYHTFYTMDIANPKILTRNVYENDGTLIGTCDISFGGMNISDVLTLMDNSLDGSTNPYIIGVIDNTINKPRFEIGYCDIYSKALTSEENTSVVTYVNAMYKEPHLTATIVYTVTISENVFWLSENGATAIANPNLLLTYGNMYVFDQSHHSNMNHQLIIFSDVDKTNRYSNGVVSGRAGYLNAGTWIEPYEDGPLYYGVDGGSVSGATLFTSVSYHNGFTLIQLVENFGFKAVQLVNIGYTLTQLKDAGYPLPFFNEFKQLVNAGFTFVQLMDYGLTSTEYSTAGFPLSDLVTNSCTVTQCLNAGFTWTELVNAGYTFEQLKADGFSSSSFKDLGFTIKQMADAGCSLSDLIMAGWTAIEIYTLSYTNLDILNNVNRTKTLVEQIMAGSTYYAPMTADDIRIYLSQEVINGLGFYTSGTNGDQTSWSYNLRRKAQAWASNNTPGDPSLENDDPSHISNWNTVFCTDMTRLFYDSANPYRNFKENLSKWNTSNVTAMTQMFMSCYKFDSDLSNWDVSKVTDMKNMFYQCQKFSLTNFSKWNVSNVNNFETMFSNCSILNQYSSVSKWKVKSTANFYGMFNSATLMLSGGFIATPNDSYFHK